jgi:hypothetical protein
LRGLLDEIGYADVLLVRELLDGGMMIIDGHLRADSDPNAFVPVLVLDLNEAEGDKLLLTLDPLAAMAESDAERIKALLETVHTDSGAVEELLKRIAGDQLWEHIHPRDIVDPPAQIDRAGEFQKKWGTKTGQLYQIGPHSLVCGDSTKPEDVARVINGERAVLFATDPLYAVGYTGGSHPQSWGIEAPRTGTRIGRINMSKREAQMSGTPRSRASRCIARSSTWRSSMRSLATLPGTAGMRRSVR